MAKLTAAMRKKLPRAVFGLPGQLKYPMPDASHAANAKARATQQLEKGNITPAQKEAIDAKANEVLDNRRKRGTSRPAKKSAVVNVFRRS